MKNLRFSTKVTLYLGNDAIRQGHSHYRMPIEPRTMTLNDLLKVISATKAYKYVDSNIDLDNGDLKLHKIGIMPIDCFGQLFIKTLYN